VKKAASSYCGCGNAVARIHSSEAFSAADQASYRPSLSSGMKSVLGGKMLKSGSSAKLIHTSLPPEPDSVGSPFSPVPKVQCPAVTTIVGLTSVPEQVNQAPGSSKRGSTAVGS